MMDAELMYCAPASKSRRKYRRSGCGRVFSREHSIDCRSSCLVWPSRWSFLAFDISLKVPFARRNVFGGCSSRYIGPSQDLALALPFAQPAQHFLIVPFRLHLLNYMRDLAGLVDHKRRSRCAEVLLAVHALL